MVVEAWVYKAYPRSYVYTLSRTLSPTLIAEYQTQLPDKKLLEAKLHEFYLQNERDEEQQNELLLE